MYINQKEDRENGFPNFTFPRMHGKLLISQGHEENILTNFPDDRMGLVLKQASYPTRNYRFEVNEFLSMFA